MKSQRNHSHAATKETGDACHFAHGMNAYKLFWVFFIGSFLGVVLETVFVWLASGSYMNRTGLVYGPFNLIYGIGAVLMTVCLYRLRTKRDLWIFTGGALLGGVYEYACSWLQQAILGTVSWDYRAMPFNVGGRVNLLYCVFWGFLALMWVKELYPRLSNWIEAHVPVRTGVALTWILVGFMLLNTAMSGAAVMRMRHRYEGRPAKTAVQQFLDKEFSDARLQEIYPSMKRV